MTETFDEATVRALGDEWSRFDPSELSRHELQRAFWEYVDDEVLEMMTAACLVEVRIAETPPFWGAGGFRAPIRGDGT